MVLQARKDTERVRNGVLTKSSRVGSAGCLLFWRTLKKSAARRGLTAFVGCVSRTASDLDEDENGAKPGEHCLVSGYRTWFDVNRHGASGVPRETGGCSMCCCIIMRRLHLSLKMLGPSQWGLSFLRGAAIVLILGVSAAESGHAQSIAPFDRLAGQWSGSGTIDLSNGSREPIKCRAAYDVLGNQKKLQLNIRCASDSYNFELQASALYSAGAISGIWSEQTHNVGGTISGRADGDHFQVLAKSQSFSASLTLITHGGRQSVLIRAQNAQASVKGASISLRRRS